MSKLKTEATLPSDCCGDVSSRKSLKRKPTSSLPLLAYSDTYMYIKDSKQNTEYLQMATFLA